MIEQIRADFKGILSEFKLSRLEEPLSKFPLATQIEMVKSSFTINWISGILVTIMGMFLAFEFYPMGDEYSAIGLGIAALAGYYFHRFLKFRRGVKQLKVLQRQL